MLRKRFSQIYLILFIGLCIQPSFAFEKEESIIQGMITDQSGKPLVGANILIENTNYGSSSDENGFYYIILPGSEESMASI